MVTKLATLNDSFKNIFWTPSTEKTATTTTMKTTDITALFDYMAQQLQLLNNRFRNIVTSDTTKATTTRQTPNTKR